ncbi:DNA alkylation repair protein [Negadavirga shengliensis]|uniref:DNA alkylation repair protein n=1 Tax=Negadavirga shengliensis TaxID=1389218 RepID=A0ABV9T531_9BACT
MVTSVFSQIISDLKSASHAEKASFFPRFFKCGPGEYGEGDKFLGVTVPVQRSIAKKFWKKVGAPELAVLLRHEYHEVRLTGLFMLTEKYRTSKTAKDKAFWAGFYLDHLDGVNNWDLVDSSADKILGSWLEDKNRSILYDFADSGDLWRQRIAVMATFHFIRQGEFRDTFKIAEILLNHPHDLIHKAVGWMLREIANRDHQSACDFLQRHYKVMPRTMLRYAIEKFDPGIRKTILAGNWAN